MTREEIFLLGEELIQLSVKSSSVVPSKKPTLICSVWTKKSYNPDSFRAQMKNIWKTRKKFNIHVAGQNLFKIEFDNEDDLELILEGHPWLFRRQIIIFDKLKQFVEWKNINLVHSPFWIKVGLYPPKCDMKDLMYAIGSTFGGILRSKDKGEFCRIKVQIDVKKPL